MQKAIQSPETPHILKEQYLKCYQSICAVFEVSFRTECETVKLATTSDVKKHVRAFKSAIDPSPDVDQQVLATNLKIIEMCKLLESHSNLNILRQTRDGCGGRGDTPVRGVRRDSRSYYLCGVLKRDILFLTALLHLLLISRRCVMI
jgi:hypothetical protein